MVMIHLHPIMGTTMSKKITRPEQQVPKAHLTVAVPKLQEILFEGRDYPRYFAPYRYSAELMKIYKILVDSPSVWENSIKYELNPEEKLHLVFGTDYRHIYTYEVIEEFFLNFGEFKNQNEIAGIEFQRAARTLRVGDQLLIRKDTRDEELKVDVQILTGGLFQDFTEDWKVLTMDTIDVGHIRKYLKLIDSDGMNE